MPRLAVIAGDLLQAEEEARAWLPAGVPITRRSGEELTTEVLFADLGQPGIFAEDRALLYTDVLAKKFAKGDSERLAALLVHLPQTTYLACIQVLTEEARKKADERLRRPEWRLFSEGADIRDIRAAAVEPGVLRWLGERATTQYGLSLSSAQLRQVLSLCDGLPSLAAGELEKLALLKPLAAPGTVAVTDDMLQILQGSPAAKFYALLDQLLASPAAAQSALEAWFAADAETYRLIYEVKRRLLQARMVQRGEQVFPPYAAREAQTLARRLGAGRLGRALEALAALEHGLKSGLYPAESSRQAELGALQIFTAALALIMRG